MPLSISDFTDTVTTSREPKEVYKKILKILVSILLIMQKDFLTTQ